MKISYAGVRLEAKQRQVADDKMVSAKEQLDSRQPLRTLLSVSTCAEETASPVLACTITASDAPIPAEQDSDSNLPGAVYP